MRFTSRLILAAGLVFIFYADLFAQKKATLTPDEIKTYTEQSKDIIAFLEGTYNFLGDPANAPAEKDIIINQSYLKIFLDYEVQIEDDLDAGRLVPLNKDVQAYLKDIVFFFKNVTFTFEINKVEQLVNQNGVVYFKVTVNRNLQGTTIENKSVNNNEVRYVEINLDATQQDLKIVSIYSTQPNEKEEIKYWWVQMPESWKNYFGKKLMIQDTIPFSSIVTFSDKTFSVDRWKEDIRIDTLAYRGEGIDYGKDADSVQFVGENVLLYTNHYVKVADSFPVDAAVIYKTLQDFRAMQQVDISGNTEIANLNPLSELAGLQELNISATAINDLSPLRGLNNLIKLDISNTSVNSLDPLRYALTLKEINAAGTRVRKINVLSNLLNLDKINLKNTLVDSLEPLSVLQNLQQLNLSFLNISNLAAVSQLPLLTDLNVSGTQISSLQEVTTLTNLKNLYIDSTLIADLTPLSLLTNLAILSANNTSVYDLTPLEKTGSLKFIYCDNTKINRQKAEKFMDINPACVVVYNSAALKEWWSALSPDWKKVFMTEMKLTEPISKEQLHEVIDQTEVNVSGNKAISGLEPLVMMHRLEILDCSNTAVSNLGPLSGLNNLRELNIDQTNVSSFEPLRNLQTLKVISCAGTGVSDLQPLAGNKNLSLILCDSTKVTQTNVLLFQKSLPTCLVIYQTGSLQQWWNGLSDDWKQVFAAADGFEGEPDSRELQSLVDMSSLSIKEKTGLLSLDPLTVFKRLSKLEISNCSISNILPVTSLTTLTELSLPNNPLSNLTGITSLKNLSSLNLENTSLEDLELIGQLTWLKSLNIAGTMVKRLKGIETMSSLENLTINNTGIKSLKGLELLTNLKELTCYRTGISNKSIETFQNSYPSIKVVYY